MSFKTLLTQLYPFFFFGREKSLLSLFYRGDIMLAAGIEHLLAVTPCCQMASSFVRLFIN